VKHKPVNQANFFKLQNGKILRSKKECPRCGAGTYLAMHEVEGRKRYYCGKCKMTIYE
jgi:ribosomal protein S27AE